jgi:hypothetical protein
VVVVVVVVIWILMVRRHYQVDSIVARKILDGSMIFEVSIDKSVGQLLYLSAAATIYAYMDDRYLRGYDPSTGTEILAKRCNSQEDSTIYTTIIDNILL